MCNYVLICFEQNVIISGFMKEFISHDMSSSSKSRRPPHQCRPRSFVFFFLHHVFNCMFQFNLDSSLHLSILTFPFFKSYNFSAFHYPRHLLLFRLCRRSRLLTWTSSFKEVRIQLINNLS